MNAPVPAATPITVRMTPTMGRGVFAVRALTEGTVLGEFHSIRLPPDEVASMAGSTLSHFWFEDDSDGAAVQGRQW